MHRLEYESQPEHGIWKDIVSDYLDVRSNLDEREQQALLQVLHHQQVQATSIKIHPCFSIEGRLIIVLESEGMRDYLIYSSKKKKLRRLRP